MKNILSVLGIVFCLMSVSAVLNAEEEMMRPGLAVGDAAPDFISPNQHGEDITLSGLYEDGPVVLIFYRGAWCPYCNVQLRSYQERIKDFEDKNISVVAVSVDQLNKIGETADKNSITYDLISNPDATILMDYKVVYNVSEDLADKYLNEYKIDLEAHSGRDDHLIAVAATYVIDTSGTIAMVSILEDYKVRISVDDVLSFIEKL